MVTLLGSDVITPILLCMNILTKPHIGLGISQKHIIGCDCSFEGKFFLHKKAQL